MKLTLEEALRKGVEAHRAGKVKEADRYYTAILKANPFHPHANHNMGILAIGFDKVNEALPFFKAALKANPQIVQFWQSYIDALIKLERFEEAKAKFNLAKSKISKIDDLNILKEKFDSFERASNKRPKSNKNQNNILDVTNLDQAIRLAGKNIKDNDIESARKIYEDILQKYPKNKKAIAGFKKLSTTQSVGHTNLKEPPQNQMQPLINLYNQGQFQQILSITSDLIFEFPYSFNLQNFIGAANKGLGNLDKAIQAYKKAIAIKPDYAEAFNNLGTALKDQGKLDEAFENYNKALTIKDDYFEAYNNLGLTLLEKGQLEKAMKAFNKALTIKPDYVEAWCNGADGLERSNQLKQLGLWLQRAYNAYDVIPSDLIFIKSNLLWREKNYDKAFSLMSEINFKTVSEIRKQAFLLLKAKVSEKFDDFDKAYECFYESNLLSKNSRQYFKSNPEEFFQNLKTKLNKLKSGQIKKPKAKFNAETRFTPTFLVGFPRSGTTLLDTILRSHSKIRIVEEQPIVRAVKIFYEKAGFNDPLSQVLSSDMIEEAQKLYELEFKKHVAESDQNFIHIDKLPLNILDTPLIHQLYPQAKFILALRHPMDTILSCWIQNFKLNPAMANMVDLNRIVEFYCVAMEIFQICRSNYNLSVHEIRYEDLIDNLSEETSLLLNFLDLEWQSGMENFQDTALKRGRIKTPSYSQVIQPLYKDSKYRWLNYEKYLFQYLDQINPWIKQFAYN